MKVPLYNNVNLIGDENAPLLTHVHSEQIPPRITSITAGLI